MRRRNRSGFTLIELLVVVSIIALLISILLPSLAKARELARRAVCATNLNGIGKGFHTYAVDNHDSWPIAAPNSTMNPNPTPVQYYNMTGKYGGPLTAGDPATQISGGYWGQLSTTRTFWVLVKTAGTSPRSFICPSGTDAPDPVENPADHWDFTASSNASTTGPDRGWNAATNNETLEFGKAFGKTLGKTIVIAKDTPGFLVNRLMMPYLMDAIRIYEAEVATKEDIDASIRLGLNHPMGPLTLADHIGLDTCLFVTNAMYEEFKDPKNAAPPLLRKMVSAGWLGRKSGKGFYEYK